MDSYRKKLTMSDAWLRPVTHETAIMRVLGKASEGVECISTLGRFTRWQGQFLAQAVQQSEASPHGMIVTLASFALILPSVANDWLTSYFVRETRETDRADPTETRTGVFFRPAGELGDIRFVVDLSIKPPASSKPSQTGYEFGMRIAKAEERFDPMAGLVADLGEFAPFLAPAAPGGGGQPSLPLDASLEADRAAL